jgi:hypothetical protein
MANSTMFGDAVICITGNSSTMSGTYVYINSIPGELLSKLFGNSKVPKKEPLFSLFKYVNIYIWVPVSLLTF